MSSFISPAPTTSSLVYNPSYFPSSSGSGDSPYTIGITPGAATGSKALVVDPNRIISNIFGLTASNLTASVGGSFGEVNVNGISNTFGGLSIKGAASKPSPNFGSTNSIVWMESSNATSPIQGEINVSNLTSATVANALRIGTNTNNDVVLFTNGTERLRVNSDRLTLRPSGASNSVFQCISGSSTFEIRHNVSSTVVLGTLTSHNFELQSNGLTRLQINSTGNAFFNGNVGINASGSIGGFTPRLYVADDISSSWLQAFRTTSASTGRAIGFFKSDTTEIGSISFNASTVSFNTSSDHRLKKEVEPLDGLSIIKKLNPVKWKWKADDSYGDGFIAHELQEHLPCLVIGEKDGLNKDGKPDYQSVNYTGLIGIIVAAIKEQNTMLENLQQDLESLKNAKSFSHFKNRFS